MMRLAVSVTAILAGISVALWTFVFFVVSEGASCIGYCDDTGEFKIEYRQPFPVPPNPHTGEK